MILSEVSIRRPVLAIVVNLVLVLLGYICYERLTVREYPNIDVPVVTVDTRYPGATAEIIESQVTTPLEEQLSGIEGIDFISSVNRAESSQITVRFRLERDADAAASDVRDRVGRTRGVLPADVDEPIVAKVEADAQPIVWLAVSSDRHSDLDVTDFADRLVKDRLQTLPGVASIRIFGERRYAMRIWLDRVRLAAYRLTPQDVEDALRQQNVEIPSGRIEGREREFTVLAETDLRMPEQFAQVILKDEHGYLVRLGDVARVEIGPYDERQIVRFKGKPAVGLGIIKQSTANPLEVSQGVRRTLPEIEKGLPEGVQVQVANDYSVFIERSIEAVYITIAEAIVLVILVIFLFLRNLRATLIPLVTIPVSLIGAFAIMYAFGFSINTLTLLAMVLAIGLVVDDAIVMLENIYRHIEAGMKPIDAAMKGSKEIGFAVIAMTLTLAAVYAPVAFQTGRTGKLFVEFALTLAGAVIVSGFTALTLSPMMCSRMLKHEQKHGFLYTLSERFLESINRGYAWVLRGALALRPLIVLLTLGVAYAGFHLHAGLKSELSPIEDRGFFLGVALAPDGSTPEFVDRYAERIEEIYREIPEVSHYFMAVGFPTTVQSLSFVRTFDWSERERSTPQIARDIAPQLAAIPGLLAFANSPPSLGQSPRSLPIEFVIQTSGSYEELQDTVQKVMDRVRANPGFANPDSDLKLNKPELRVAVDREKVEAVGARIDVIGRTLETLLGGRDVTRFKMNAEQYDVVVKVEDRDRTKPRDLTDIYVRGNGGEMIQLANLVTVHETVAPRELNHFNKLRSATVSASLAPDYSLGAALEFLEDTVREVGTVATQADYNGVSREYKEASAGLMVTLVLALCFIYLVLAAQFESFVDPVIILVSVPLAGTGALLALSLTGGSWNIYSQIGIVTLIGLITKHGILIVEFANQLQLQGRNVREAVIEAAVLRLRPILMTTGAMVLGAVPLALATGAGAESREQIGWVIVGGMLLGTLLTLFVVPAFYTLIARRHLPFEESAGVPALGGH